MQANLEVVQLDLQVLARDSASGALPATIKKDARTLNADTRQLLRIQLAFAKDAIADTTP